MLMHFFSSQSYIEKTEKRDMKLKQDVRDHVALVYYLHVLAVRMGEEMSLLVMKTQDPGAFGFQSEEDTSLLVIKTEDPFARDGVLFKCIISVHCCLLSILLIQNSKVDSGKGRKSRLVTCDAKPTPTMGQRAKNMALMTTFIVGSLFGSVLLHASLGSKQVHRDALSKLSMANEQGTVSVLPTTWREECSLSFRGSQKRLGYSLGYSSEPNCGVEQVIKPCEDAHQRNPAMASLSSSFGPPKPQPDAHSATPKMSMSALKDEAESRNLEERLELWTHLNYSISKSLITIGVERTMNLAALEAAFNALNRSEQLEIIEVVRQVGVALSKQMDVSAADNDKPTAMDEISALEAAFLALSPSKQLAFFNKVSDSSELNVAAQVAAFHLLSPVEQRDFLNLVITMSHIFSIIKNRRAMEQLEIAKFLLPLLKSHVDD